MTPLEKLIRFVDESKRLVVLTGAGCSTESGIPDYRSPGGAYEKRKPMMIGEFLGSEASRRYYWARSYVGWSFFSSVKPNRGHLALATLEKQNRIHFLFTQNVDRLHHAAGSDPLELHGSNHDVVCMTCGTVSPRREMQRTLEELNPQWTIQHGAMAPDGDMILERDATKDFVVPPCGKCGGILKPHVVFFGESVDKKIVQDAMDQVEAADALLVVGSSLMVWSGFRFARRAHERGIPVTLLNIGPTRADELASLKVEEKCGDALSAVVTALGFSDDDAKPQG